MVNKNEEQICIKLDVENVYAPKKDLSLLTKAMFGKRSHKVNDSAIPLSEFEDDELFWTKIPVQTGSVTFQDFNEIRTRCLAEDTLFQDPEFPTKETLNVTWQRPGALCKDPKLFVDGFSRFDVQQGKLGDCWLHAAIANLTQNKKLFFQVVPDDQSFDKGEYAGVFHFRFWQYGQWVDVVIDDRLPTYRCTGKLIYGHSPELNEFWCPLLEKAYAKLYGSYEILAGGNPSTALLDLTGGVVETFRVEDLPPNFYATLLKAYERHSLIATSIYPGLHKYEEKTTAGLGKGHAYTISRVQYVTVDGEKIPLLRVRNPWGNAVEWNGAWSDKSKEWNSISESVKEKMGVHFDQDGEFWMTYQDFCKNFSEVNICNLDPKYLDSAAGTKTWVMSLSEGEWIKGLSAGGCRAYWRSFWRNPQYTITLTDVDDGDVEETCTVVVDLIQKTRPSQKLDVLSIGLPVYRLPDDKVLPKPLDQTFFCSNDPVASITYFTNAKEVNLRLKLSPGTYVIIPSTYYPEKEGKFLLRVLSEKNSNMTEYGKM